MKKYIFLFVFILLSVFFIACEQKTEVVLSPKDPVQTIVVQKDTAQVQEKIQEPAKLDQSISESNKTGVQVSPEISEVKEKKEASEQTSLSTSVKEFLVTAKQWEFIPSTITVNKGDAVKITITSIEGEHSFSLPEYKIQESLSLNKPVVIEFTANKAGTFPFACTVFCGKGHGGMRGMLIVKEE